MRLCGTRLCGIRTEKTHYPIIWKHFSLLPVGTRLGSICVCDMCVHNVFSNIPGSEHYC